MNTTALLVAANNNTGLYFVGGRGFIARTAEEAFKLTADTAKVIAYAWGNNFRLVPLADAAPVYAVAPVIAARPAPAPVARRVSTARPAPKNWATCCSGTYTRDAKTGRGWERCTTCHAPLHYGTFAEVV